MFNKPYNKCPLDGYPVENHPDDPQLRICTHCSELLSTSELVTRATPKTRREYLGHGTTDTQPQDVPWISLRQMIFGPPKRKQTQ